jgi:hypothetical protein
MLTVTPQNVYADSTGALVIFQGPPNRAVTWSLDPSDDGTLTPFTNFTNANGVSAAMYVPGNGGTTVTVQVQYGA